jgi:hypothetical protein
MRIQRISGVLACATLISLAGCGKDSTGPSNLDSASALQSLRLGLGSISDIEGPSGATAVASLGAIAPLLDQVTVDIDGTSRTMFGLVLRESYPAGTCDENVFVDPSFPPPPGVCTPVSLGTALILWQSHAASAPPDRMIFIVGDEGTTNFDFTSTASFPGIAIYIEGPNFLLSSTGTLTSHTVSSGSTCTVPLPPYAKSATCTLATFSEQGSITLESDPGTSGSAHRTLTLAPQSLHGLWLAITEVQPVSLPTALPLFGLRRF